MSTSYLLCYLYTYNCNIENLFEHLDTINKHKRTNDYTNIPNEQNKIWHIYKLSRSNKRLMKWTQSYFLILFFYSTRLFFYSTIFLDSFIKDSYLMLFGGSSMCLCRYMTTQLLSFKIYDSSSKICILYLVIYYFIFNSLKSLKLLMCVKFYIVIYGNFLNFIIFCVYGQEN